MIEPVAGEKAIEESAKAVQEVAKTSGQAIEAARDGLTFLAQLFGESLEQVARIVNNRLAFMAWKDRWRVVLKMRKFAIEHGLPEPTRQVPPKLLLPLLENAAIEEDDELQDVWARMLVNAADADSEAEVRRAYISILADCTSLDIRNLATLYQGGGYGQPICAEFLPGEARPVSDAAAERHASSVEVERSLWNLRRLGLIAPVMAYADGTDRMMNVHITALGIGFVEACTLRNREG